MAKFTVKLLEGRVKGFNDKMILEGEKHPKYKQWEASRNYYVNKLSEMDEYDLKTIEI